MIAPLKRKQVPRKVPIYKKPDWDSLKTAMKDLHERMVLMDYTDTEALWKTFLSTLKEAVQEHIPHQQLRAKDSKPWVIFAIKRLIRRRDRLYKKMKKSGSDAAAVLSKEVRREVQRQLRRAYWGYLTTTFENADPEQAQTFKKFWAYKGCSRINWTGVISPKVHIIEA